jgi:hypothetical protein
LSKKLDDWTLVEMPGGESYAVPDIIDSPDGWGPSAEPEKLQGVPFAPFSKTDKLGRAADWTNQNYQKFSGAFAWAWRGAEGRVF